VRERAGDSHLARRREKVTDNGKMRQASTQQHFAEADGWRQAGDGLEECEVCGSEDAGKRTDRYFLDCPWP